MVHVFDLRTWGKSGTMENEAPVTRFKFNQDRLVCGMNNGIVQVWENWVGVAPKKVIKINQHKGEITCLYLGKSCIISSATDGLINVYRFGSTAFEE